VIGKPNNMSNTSRHFDTRNLDILVNQAPIVDYTTDGLSLEGQEYKKFVSAVKKQIRQSPEYKNWLSALHRYAYTDYCAITGLDRSIEVHHEPIRLTTYIETAMNVYIANNETFASFDIARLVIHWHYSNYIGWIPLTQPIHKLVHDQELFIPSFLIRGNWIQFVKEYYRYMPESALLSIYGYYQKHVELGLPSTFYMDIDIDKKTIKIEFNYDIINNLNNIDFVSRLIQLAQERLNFNDLIQTVMQETQMIQSNNK